MHSLPPLPYVSSIWGCELQWVSMVPAILLALLPGLMLYAHNAAQLHPQQLVTPLALASGAAILCAVLLNLWLRRLSL